MIDALSSIAAGRRAWLGGSAAVLAACFLLLVGLAGCGYKTKPRPGVIRLPGVAEIAIHRRENQAFLSWWLPTREGVTAGGGLNGFSLEVAEVPLTCPACPPEKRLAFALPLHSPALRLEGPQAVFLWPLPSRSSLWRFHLTTLYKNGQGYPVASAFLEASAEIPTPVLGWQWVPSKNPQQGRPKARLYWARTKEGTVRVLVTGGAMVERERFFRANVYRSRPGRPWPLWPQNNQPLETPQWIAQPSLLGETQAAFTLRLVDQAGNEGPAATPVLINFSTNSTPGAK